MSAANLELVLRDTAERLGLRIKITYDPIYPGYFIDCAMRHPPRAGCTIGEEVITRAETHALVGLLDRELRDLQARTFDEVAKLMSEKDVRGRVYLLTNEDKQALHDMYMDACSARGGSVDEYNTLLDRLFR